MSEDSAVTVQIAAQTDQFVAGIQKAAMASTQLGRTFNPVREDALALDNALSKLMGTVDKASKNAQQLANAQALLDRNLQAGNISANTHAVMMAKVQGAYGQAAEGAKGATFATAGVSRELIVLGHEAMTGNFSRMPGTMVVLASRMGNLGAIFAALASPVGLATIAIGGLAAAMTYLGVKAAQAEKHMQALQDNMAATGRSGVYTKQMLEGMTDALHKSGEISKQAAQEIVDVFVRTRQIGGPLMQELVGIVEKFSTATGKTAPDAAKELAKAFADPAKGAKTLDEELGLLTAAQMRLIEEQVRQGHTSQAQGTLLDALKSRMQGVGDATKYAADQMVRERALEQGVQLDDKPKAGVEADPAAAQREKEKQAVKETLDATGKLQTVTERRKALQDEVLRIQEAQKVATGEEADILQGRLLEAQRQIADMKGKGDQSRLQGFKAELEAMKTAEDGFLDFSKGREIEFWQSKLALLRKGSADYAAVNQEIFNLRKSEAKQDLDEQVAEIKQGAALYRTGSQERIKAAQEAAQLIGAAYGQESKQYKDAQKEINAELRAGQQYQRQIDEEILNAKRAHAKSGYDIARDELTFQQSIGAITAQERIAGLRQIEQQEYQMERQSLQDKLNVANVEPLERTKINGQIEQLEANHQRKMVKLNQDAALESQRKWTTFWQPVGQAFETGVAAMLMKTQTLRQGMVNIFQAILASFLHMIGREVAEWVAATALMQSIKVTMGIGGAATSAAGSSPQVVAETANTAALGVNTTAQGAVATSSGLNTTSLGLNATALGVNTTALATLTAAVTANTAAQGARGAGGAVGFLSNLIPGFAVGAWDLPGDTLAKVHKGEMIVPAQASEGLRKFFSVGGWSVPGDVSSGAGSAAAAVSTSVSSRVVNNASSSHTASPSVQIINNVSAVDGDSVRKFFRENRGALSKQITTSVRDHGLRMGSTK